MCAEDFLSTREQRLENSADFVVLHTFEVRAEDCVGTEACVSTEAWLGAKGRVRALVVMRTDEVEWIHVQNFLTRDRKGSRSSYGKYLAALGESE